MSYPLPWPTIRVSGRLSSPKTSRRRGPCRAGTRSGGDLTATRAAVADVQLLTAGVIPRTTSGKLARRAEYLPLVGAVRRRANPES
jgi:hypothetical protein